MRLRVRDASSGRTWRVQLDQSSPTFQNLEDSVIQQCFDSQENTSDGSHKLALALNKKDPIHSDADTALNSLGICNGDLVWIISPVPLAAAPIKETSTDTLMAEQPVAAPSAAHKEEEHPMEIDPEEGPSTSYSQYLDDSYIPVPVGLRIPGYLLRVLNFSPTTADNSPSSTSTTASELDPVGVLLLMGHAAMLETGFTYIDTTAAAGSSNKGKGEAVDADENSSYRLSLATTAISPGVYRLQYNLANTTSTKDASTPPACTLIISSMGDSVLIAASAEDGKHARHVILNWKAESYVVPFISSPSREQKQVEEGESLKLGDCVEITPRQDIILLSSNKQEQEAQKKLSNWKVEHEALKKVWNILKDSIALPMLTAACLSAGFSPPAGLLTLPTEVKDILLALLPAIDLAALGATCTELRHLTCSDELWKPLFLADFPVPPVEISDAALKKGYKWAYAHCFIEKRRIDEERQQRRQRRYVIPGLPLGPRPPYYPIPGPRGFPGVIGGDQDRLPFLPGPPGRFTFGGGGGGGGIGGGGWS